MTEIEQLKARVAELEAMITNPAPAAQAGDVRERFEQWYLSGELDVGADPGRLMRDEDGYYCEFDIQRLYAGYEAGARQHQSGEAGADTRRLDWLCEHVVNVRLPLPYGSRDMFWASPTDDDGGHESSNLRWEIDAAMAEQAQKGGE